MSEKTLKRIVVIVGFLAVGYGLATIARTGLGTRGETGAGDAELARVLAGLELESVQEVLFTEDGDTVRLAREREQWTVDGFRADSGRVARFWNALAGQEAGSPVVRNPANHPRLGVAEDQANTLVLTTMEGERHEILLGDSGPTDPSVYVRLAGTDAVHLLESSLAVSAGQSLTTWRDHTIARVDTSRIRSVEVTTPEDAYTVSREDDGWTVGDEAGDPAQARNLLGGLARVLASDFYAVEGAWPEAVTDDAEERRIVALSPEGDTLTALTIRGSADSGYAVRARGDSTVYEIASFDIGRLFPPRAALTGP